MRVALVIGGSSGIGRAITHALAEDGWCVAVAARNVDRLSEVVSDLPVPAGMPDHSFLAMDATDEQAVGRGVEQVLDRYGQIDLLVASIGPGPASGLPPPSSQLSVDAWKLMLDTQLTAVYVTNRAVLPTMRQRGQGMIVNVGSALTPHGMRGRAYAPAYSAAKYAASAFTEALAAEVRGFGIRVFMLYPGPVDTPLIARTALTRGFWGAMRPESFGRTVSRFVDLSDDAIVTNAIVIPFRGGVDGQVRS